MNDHSKRIALYGGAFDPVHNAHLEIARRALQQAELDEVVFIPSAQSPLKAHGPQVGDAHRLQMLDLATAGEVRFRVDRFELEKGGVSYSLDTARHFQRVQPAAALDWIIGADQFEQLADWRQIEALAGIVRFLVFARPGYRMAVPSIAGLRFLQLSAPLMAESSSEIRQRVAGGQSISSFVPPAVEAFILAHGLYSSS